LVTFSKPAPQNKQQVLLQLPLKRKKNSSNDHSNEAAV
jgi:hypothetical protein